MKLESLKNSLKTLTLVGEYVGGFFNQHITLEKEEKIVFYAAVEKTHFKNDLLPFLKAKKIITSFGLEFVSY